MIDDNYYVERLAGERLEQCYRIAPPRVQRYLQAEVDHVLSNISQGKIVLDLGCGYGRIIPQLAQIAGFVVGIDNSPESVSLARQLLKDIPNCLILEMNAARLTFRDNVFDVTICIQNGISAFHVDQKALVKESLRVTKRGGTVLFSTYSDKFWEHRLEWFRLQSQAGLLGEIDYTRSRNGVIVCKDGFTAMTLRPRNFLSLVSDFDIDVAMTEVDESSMFFEVTKRFPKTRSTYVSTR